MRQTYRTTGIFALLAATCAGQEGLENHANCTYFVERTPSRSALTVKVVRSLPAIASVRPAAASVSGTPGNVIDKYVFQQLQDAGIAPAPPSTDLEFLRRVTLDLTGRIPSADTIAPFVNDATSTKRASLIDQLLKSPEWVDKWTMFFGDLLVNAANNDQVRRFPSGRNAFYAWIRDSLKAGKPYNQMAAELINATGDDSYTQGNLNWLIGSIVTGGPQQDIWDQQTYKTFETFLGISHMNCLLCHDGRGHLDTLSLWGRNTKRTQAWAVSAFYSRTLQARTPVAAGTNNYYWALRDNPPQIRTDYRLNTTTGNRPARCKDNVKPDPGKPCPATATVAPQYLDGEGPASGESYRAALARKVTGDFQFARAAVNSVWAQFFGRGLVDPVNQFDLARLDPDNPPPAPWSLQPTHPRLLKELAQQFVDSGYDLKALMRTIVDSRAYQLSARYDGDWNPAWESLYARKLVRRLWSEEIHDAIVQATSVVPNYNIAGLGQVHWAMQLPETAGMPDGANGAVSQFLDAFLRGNRNDQDRRDDGSLLQALNLMNDPFVMNRVKAISRQVLPTDDAALVKQLYLAALSRPPTEEELASATGSLRGVVSTDRARKVQNLLWALFNKVDFIFNY